MSGELNENDPLGPGTYFARTRRPVVCLAFLAPLLVLYEVGAVWLVAAGGEDVAAGGADGLLRGLLGPLGGGAAVALPAVVAAVLLGWNFYGRYRWEVDAETLAGMLGESLLFAAGLVLAAAGLTYCSPGGLTTAEVRPPAAVAPAAVRAVGALGAGVYEEFLFRLALLPPAYGWFRLWRCGPRGAAALAVVATSLLFALAHHLGPELFNGDLSGAGGEAPRWGPFLFRAAAGAMLAVLFWFRGFGVAAGTHAAFNLFAGVLLAE